MKRIRGIVDASFPGAACPPGSRVKFRCADEHHVGMVARLRLRCVEVADAQGDRWEVPYAGIEVVQRAPSHCTLAQVEALAQKLLKQCARRSGLAPGWTFGFDLSPSRAGVCRYDERRIDLSVSFCLRASRAQVEDTLLHEIAHAIVGRKHGHDAVWQAKARELGCSAERCHDVAHSAANWVGECGCGKQWLRQRLQRNMARGRVCAACRGEIRWRRHRPEGA